MTRFAVALIAGLMLSRDVSAEVRKTDVDITAPNGVTLKGTYSSPGTRGPAILLLHGCFSATNDRHVWDGLAGDLVNAGFHVLTADFRGYGQSHDATTDAAQQLALRPRWSGDVDVMLNYLLAQEGVDRSRLAAGAVGCSVVEITGLAERRPGIGALIAISGASNDAAARYVARTPSLGVFATAAKYDNAFGWSLAILVNASTNPRSTLKIFQGSEKSTQLFTKDVRAARELDLNQTLPELRPMIVSWLRTQLASSGSSN